MDTPAQEDIDYMCVFGKEPHITAGPDKGDVLRGVDPKHAPATYHGHEVSHGACPRHAQQFARSAQGYVEQRRTERSKRQLEEGSTTHES